MMAFPITSKNETVRNPPATTRTLEKSVITQAQEDLTSSANRKLSVEPTPWISYKSKLSLEEPSQEEPPESPQQIIWLVGVLWPLHAMLNIVKIFFDVFARFSEYTWNRESISYQNTTGSQRDGGENIKMLPLRLLDLAFSQYLYVVEMIEQASTGCPPNLDDPDVKRSWASAFHCATQLSDAASAGTSQHHDLSAVFQRCLYSLLLGSTHDQPRPGSKYIWKVLPDQSDLDGTSVGLVYCIQATGQPLVMFEIGNELGKYSNPSDQLQRLHRRYFVNNPIILETDNPIFLISLSGTYITVGGGFFDPSSINLVADNLGDPVKLARVREVAVCLFALKCGINCILPLQKAKIHPSPTQNFPRVVPFTVVDKAVVPGWLFLAHRDEAANPIPQKLDLLPSQYLVKVAFKKEHTYGILQHKYLAQEGYAPSYFHTIISPSMRFHLFEYLPPPADGRDGWLDLFEFSRSHNHHARSAQESVKNVVLLIVDLLEARSYVHGDLRPNNIMIKVRADGTPVTDEDGRVFLKVVDFDWAGEASKVFYPRDRNASIQHWAGEAMGPIEAGHDRELVENWLNDWLLLSS